jgi:hypothetical protein
MECICRSFYEGPIKGCPVHDRHAEWAKEQEGKRP